MTGDLYRDAYVGIRARLAELDARIQDREAEVTEAFWETVSDELREQLEYLRSGRELAGAESLDDLARGETMLTAYLDELEKLISRLPSVEAEWREVPNDVPDPPESRVSFRYGSPTEEAESSFLRHFTAMVRERSREAEVIDKSPMYRARFRDNDAPFALRATLYVQNGQVAEVGMWLVTSIARALPSLIVRHETLVLSVGKFLGIKHEVEVGEPSFDGLFLIEGSKEAAELYLTPGVRTQLLALSRFDIPTLHVDPPSRTASLRWRFEPAPKALDAAIRILTAVRDSRASVRFRKE
jgi:hypothetical protein